MLDSPSFRAAFGDAIPKHFFRQDLSVFTRQLQQDTQVALLNKLRGCDIFLLVDGGTLNRKRLLNACLGWNGETYFYKSLRVPNLTAAEVCVFLTPRS